MPKLDHAALLEKLRMQAAKSTLSPDHSPYDIWGSDPEECYYGGVNDGETYMARAVLEWLGEGLPEVHDE